MSFEYFVGIFGITTLCFIVCYMIYPYFLAYIFFPIFIITIFFPYTLIRSLIYDENPAFHYGRLARFFNFNVNKISVIKCKCGDEDLCKCMWEDVSKITMNEKKYKNFMDGYNFTGGK